MTPTHPAPVALDTRDASPGATGRGLSLPRPVTVPACDGDGYLVAQQYHAHVIPGHELTILMGFRFDGASIPRSCWSILGIHPMHPRVIAAALIHDALYAGELCDRATADATFRACLRLDGVSGFRAWLMYRAVRIGGWAVWRRHTPGSVALARMYCSLTPCA